MSNTTAKDAFGFDALSTYTDDGLGINALPYSEKYKKVSEKIQLANGEQ
jgi:hypothetical protein